MAIPSYLLATILREQFAPKSFLGSLFGTHGAFTGMGAAIIVLTLACTPYVQILASAALRSVPEAEEEAARSLGAKRWARFLRLTIPRLRPTWAFSMILVSLYVVSDFGAVSVLDCRVLTWELYNSRGARDAYQIALGILVCVLPLLAAIRMIQGAEISEAHHGSGRVSRSRSPLKGWSLSLVYLTHIVFIGLGVVVPIATLLIWVLRGVYYGAEFASVSDPMMMTAVYAFLGSAFIVLASIMPAAMASRSSSSARWIEHGTYVTSSIPGVLIAFGILNVLLFIKRNSFIASSDSFALKFLQDGGLFLLAAYVMRFLSQGYAAIRPALIAVDQRQIDAARSLGAKTATRVARIWLPSMASGLTAASILAFIAVAKELPITLMLAPAGHQTLAYRIFDAQSEASLPDVGLAGILLLAIVAAVQFLASRWR
ncbi:ABC transporter permease subunit [Myxococcota bacterium]|nr:ABC transporter permease subunit [Myxococcota bacterium]